MPEALVSPEPDERKYLVGREDDVPQVGRMLEMLGELSTDRWRTASNRIECAVFGSNLSSQKFQLDRLIDKLLGRLQDNNDVSLGRQLRCSFNDLMRLSGPAWGRTKIYFHPYPSKYSFQLQLRRNSMMIFGCPFRNAASDSHEIKNVLNEIQPNADTKFKLLN